MKNIEKRLKAWRESRNITTFPLTIKDDLLGELEEVRQALRKLDWDNYVEELADIEIFALNGIGLLNMSYQKRAFTVEPSLNQIESYINSIRIEHPLQTYMTLCTLVTLCNELIMQKRYDFKKVVNEKIKVVESRLQCPIQKKHWETHGVSGKWEKSKRQEDKDLVYIGNYGKCKL